MSNNDDILSEEELASIRKWLAGSPEKPTGQISRAEFMQNPSVMHDYSRLDVVDSDGAIRMSINCPAGPRTCRCGMPECCAECACRRFLATIDAKEVKL